MIRCRKFVWLHCRGKSTIQIKLDKVKDSDAQFAAQNYESTEIPRLHKTMLCPVSAGLQCKPTIAD